MKSGVIVVCTKDRPEPLNAALNSIDLQSVLPQMVLVVDSSATGESEAVVNQFQSSNQSGIRTEFLRCTPGLTHQRNIAISECAGQFEYVHFIDDDAVLERDYLKEILTTFHEFYDALAVGGRITNLPTHAYSRAGVYFGWESPVQGVVLPSGVNILNFTGNLVRRTHWLSGCSMSFRTAVFQVEKFDERRTGNGTGEDVDFCLRVGRHGALYWNPHAKLLHIQSQINRDDEFAARVNAQRHFFLLARDGLAPVVASRVWLTAIVHSLYRFAKAIRRRSRKGVCDELRFWQRVCR